MEYQLPMHLILITQIYPANHCDCSVFTRHKQKLLSRTHHGKVRVRNGCMPVRLCYSHSVGPSVCLSVCLSQMNCVEIATAKRIIILCFTTHMHPLPRFGFSRTTHRGKIPTRFFSTGRQIPATYKKSRFSTNVSSYHASDTRHEHG